MLLSDFDFELPEELIAQVPLADRAGARMMHLRRKGESIVDCQFRDFAGLLREDDLLVFNNTRVVPGRLLGRRLSPHPSLAHTSRTERAKNGAPSDVLTGRVEVLLTKRLSEWEWEALVRPGRKLGVGERVGFFMPQAKREVLRCAQDDNSTEHDVNARLLPLRYAQGRNDNSEQGDASEQRSFDSSLRSSLRMTPVADSMTRDAKWTRVEGDAPLLQCDIVGRGEFGKRVVRFDALPDFEMRLQTVGHVPLPPYIARGDTEADRERYQTVYADPKKMGAAAAPTAGLHFTREILDAIRGRGIEMAEVTLHVGLGTFQPLREQVVEANQLHRERYEISETAAEKIAQAQRERRRIVAVGTTSVRTLEFASRQSADGTIRAGAGEADIFIYPGYQFRVVGAMLTNFHLPQSSLLMLVCAFGTTDYILRAYRHSVAAGYRFFSYGDCMFIE